MPAYCVCQFQRRKETLETFAYQDSTLKYWTVLRWNVFHKQEQYLLLNSYSLTIRITCPFHIRVPLMYKLWREVVNPYQCF